VTDTARHPARRLPVLDVAAALIVFAIMRKGAFYPPDDLWLPGLVAIAAVIGVAVRWRALDRRDWLVIPALLLLGLWWYTDAMRRGHWDLSRQVVGSAVGFAACYAIGRTLDDAGRRALRSGAVLVATLTASVGLVGLALRSQPLALPAQGHLRLAGTLTYSNATGALLAVLLIVTVSTPASRWRDPQLVLITGALVATQSRGALLAALVALVVLWRHVPAAAASLGLGLVLGAVAVAGSGRTHTDVALLVLVVLLPAAAGVLLPAVRIEPRTLLAAAAVVVLLAATATVVSAGLREAVRTRVSTASVSDRAYEWRAGWRDFVEHPLAGAGPGHRLVLADGRTARFVHNEPLQVAADSGLIGVGLLAIAFAAPLIRRREPHRVVAGSAVLSAFVVCGLLDFPWHLPAIPMTVGLLLAGLPYATSNTSPGAGDQPIA
jgi:O-antigen ligase